MMSDWKTFFKIAITPEMENAVEVAATAPPGTAHHVPVGFTTFEFNAAVLAYRKFSMTGVDKANEQQKAEPGWKQDAGKARMDLIAPEFLEGTANVLAFGAGKYAERNWEKGMSWGRVFGAMMRHLWAWWGGERLDRETGLSHLYHASCCLMFLAAYEERQIGKDDRKLPVDTL